MKDGFNREINYMRISITDLCNFKCAYCMPKGGVKKLPREQIITHEEIESIVKIGAEFGINKVRLTGGEPLIRRGIIGICSAISDIPEITDLAVTTNGYLLTEYAEELKKAGVNRLNISLDTLNKDKFEKITRTSGFDETMAGIKKAMELGFDKIKINAVLMRGFNDDEILDFINLTRDEAIEVRFIEMMPIGQAMLWEGDGYLPNSYVLEKAPNLRPEGTSGVARIYRAEGYAGSVGLISPVSNHFCPECNRIRVTADGHLKACLNSKEEYIFKGKSYEEMRQTYIKAVTAKPEGYEFSQRGSTSTERYMSQIGG